MTEHSLKGIRVAILATDGFEEIELVAPRRALDEVGAKTTVIAPKSGTIYGMKHHDKVGQVKVDLELANARPGDFDAVVLPGGALIAVICHGPWLLISAGLVKGRRLTSYHTIQDDVRNAGGKWDDKEVIRDSNWVSSRQPSDIPAFDREMLALFGERKARSQAAR